MKLRETIRRWFGVKESATTRAILLNSSYTNWSADDLEKVAREGYTENVIVFAAINSIARSAAAVPWYLRGSDGERVEDQERHPLMVRLNRPNPDTGRARFFANVTAYLLISGNSYIEFTKGRELYSLRPDRVTVIPGSSSARLIGGYKYTVGVSEVTFQPEEVLHLKTFHPIDDYYGKSPLYVAAKSIDTHNALLAWNYGLIKNNARPSCVFQTDEPIDDVEFERLKSELVGEWAGNNAPKLLDNGLKYQATSLSPTDLDYIQGERLLARLLCVGLGYPPELIGDASLKTYSNYQEARRALYEECILPYLDYLRDELNTWLLPKFGEGVTLEYDKDEIPALQENRQVVFTRLYTADWLTLNEQREASGYDRIEDPEADVPRALLQSRAFANVGVSFDAGDAEAAATEAADEASGDAEEVEEPDPKDAEDAANQAAEEAGKACLRPLSVKARFESEEEKAAAWSDLERRRKVFESTYAKEFQRFFAAERDIVAMAIGSVSEPDEGNFRSKLEDSLRQTRKPMEKLLLGLYSTVSRHFFTETRAKLLGRKYALPSERKEVLSILKGMRAFFGAEVPRRVEAMQATTSNRISGILEEGIFGRRSTDEIVDEIIGAYEDSFIPSRAPAIAGNEVVQIGNYGSDRGARSTGLNLRKLWITQRDNRVRGNPAGLYPDSGYNHWAADGQQVGVEDQFVVSSERLDFPGDTSYGASMGNVVNCRCGIEWISVEPTNGNSNGNS